MTIRTNMTSLTRTRAEAKGQITAHGLKRQFRNTNLSLAPGARKTKCGERKEERARERERGREKASVMFQIIWHLARDV